jgi:hypothetical protein
MSYNTIRHGIFNGQPRQLVFCVLGRLFTKRRCTFKVSGGSVLIARLLSIRSPEFQGSPNLTSGNPRWNKLLCKRYYEIGISCSFCHVYSMSTAEPHFQRSAADERPPRAYGLGSRQAHLVSAPHLQPGEFGPGAKILPWRHRQRRRELATRQSDLTKMADSAPQSETLGVPDCDLIGNARRSSHWLVRAERRFGVIKYYA